ncbi:endolytic transglycosylase MltG [Nocardia thailandica]|uniref:Endolytic murein transglycosylase n=2 Tax=Nocardia thailandica TaxID=257275 RepID=A0ABW6PPK3_9NOCA
MTDRWTRAEERYKAAEADRRYRRRDDDWGADARSARARTAEPDAYAARDWDNEDDDTNVIPRFEDDYEPEPEPEPAPRRRPRPRETAEDAPRTRKGAPRPRPDGARPARGERPEGRRGERGEGSPRRRRSSRAASRRAAERKKRRRTLWLVAVVFAVLFVGAVGFAGYKFISDIAPAEDFAGPGGDLVVVQVHSGDTATQIAETMFDKGVVASSAAFYEAAVKNTAMNSLQPGYYAVPQRSPAAQAVTTLVGKGSRVGNLVISEGRQLHDQQDVNTGARKEGLYTKIAAASCIGSGPSPRCVTVDQLDAAGASTDLAGLGVPEWARASVSAAPDRKRQLEGLIAAGTWDFDPGQTPQQILRQLITTSAAKYEETGLLRSGTSNGLDPYQTLIAASLVEREALPQDMPKVARVIVNRLKIDQPLQFDSTVNYSLDQTEVATTDADRTRVTPWNTYAMAGLPANPISSPSLNALKAMENPEVGPWLYFVTIDKKGTTLFTESYAEHLRNIQKAQQSGILDSGR